MNDKRINWRNSCRRYVAIFCVANDDDVCGIVRGFSKTIISSTNAWSARYDSNRLKRIFDESKKWIQNHIWDFAWLLPPSSRPQLVSFNWVQLGTSLGCSNKHKRKIIFRNRWMWIELRDNVWCERRQLRTAFETERRKRDFSESANTENGPASRNENRLRLRAAKMIFPQRKNSARAHAGTGHWALWSSPIRETISILTSCPSEWIRSHLQSVASRGHTRIPRSHMCDDKNRSDFRVKNKAIDLCMKCAIRLCRSGWQTRQHLHRFIFVRRGADRLLLLLLDLMIFT